MTDRVAIHVTTELCLRPADVPDKFQGQLEAVMDELLLLEESDPTLADASIGGDASTGNVTVEILVYTDDPLDAIAKAACTTRTALHAAGNATEGWPGFQELFHALQQATTRTEPARVPA